MSVTKDVDAMVEHMKEFVEEYNGIMQNLYLRLDPPETDTTETDDEELTEEEIALRGVLENDPVVERIFNELRAMVYKDLDGSNKEIYYSSSITGYATDSLSTFGITGGTLSVTVDGSSTPTTITYSGTDTVETVMDKLNLVSPYVQAYVVEESGTFSFYLKGSKDFNIVDVSEEDSIAFRDYFMTEHEESVLTYDYLTKIGVGSSDGYTGGYLQIVKGQIMLDEDTLRAALEDDAEAVWKTFGANESFGDTTIEGFATQLSNKLYDITKYGSGVIAQTAGVSGTINNQLRVINSQIVTWSERLTKRYEALVEKFATMEETISAWQSQSTYITQALENMNAE
jgi:flagellar hook-associated protein 2